MFDDFRSLYSHRKLHLHRTALLVVIDCSSVLFHISESAEVSSPTTCRLLFGLTLVAE